MHNTTTNIYVIIPNVFTINYGCLVSAGSSALLSNSYFIFSWPISHFPEQLLQSFFTLLKPQIPPLFPYYSPKVLLIYIKWRDNTMTKRCLGYLHLPLKTFYPFTYTVFLSSCLSKRTAHPLFPISYPYCTNYLIFFLSLAPFLHHRGMLKPPANICWAFTTWQCYCKQFT